MPLFDIKNPVTGETLTIDSPREPTQADADEIFSKRRSSNAAQALQAGMSAASKAEYLLGLGMAGRSLIEREKRQKLEELARHPMRREQKLLLSLKEPVVTAPEPQEPGKQLVQSIPTLGIPGTYEPDASGRFSKDVPQFPWRESLLGISPEDIPSGAGTTHPGITIPISVAGKTLAGLAGFLTSPEGASETAGMATPAAPAIMIKWAYDLIKGGKESAEDAVDQVRQMATEAVNKRMAEVRGIEPPEGTPPAEHYQKLAEDAVNAAVGSLAGLHLGAKGIRELPKTFKPKGAPDASQVRETSPVHEDVRPQPKEGAGQVPTEVSGEGVQPHGETPVQAEVKTKTLTPTIMAGDVPFTGKSHADALTAAREAKASGKITTEQLQSAVENFLDDDQHLFTHGKERLTRSKAWDRFKELFGEEPKNPKSRGKLFSEDMTDEQKGFGEKPKAAPTPQPELIPMGGDVRKDLQPQGTPTSNKNAVVDRERAERGLQPMMSALKQTFGDWWTKAMAIIDQDPGYQDRLISELLEKPRPLTGEENAALLQRRADLRNEYEKAARDGQQAYEDGRDDGVQEAKQRIAMWSDKLAELEQAVGKGGAGTESGRSLAARKMMMNSDYSLASLEMQKRAANNFEPLTDAQRQEIIDLHNKLQATEKAYQERIEKLNQQNSELEAQKKIAEIKAQAVPKLDKRVLDFAESIVTKMEKAAEPAAQRLRERLKMMGTSPDPTIIADAAIVGSAKIARLGLDLAKWTDAMVKDFGEKIRPMLDEIWKASNAVLEERLSKAPEPVKRRVKKQDAAEAIETNKTAIGDRVNKGEQAEITPLVQKLVRAIVERDPKIELWPLVDEVHGILKEFMPEITRREAMDAISGYGDFKQLSKDAISVKIRDYKGQLQLIAKLQDLEARVPLKRSGREQREFTAEHRKLTKQVNELKRRLGVVVTDPATQLKSALDARKTYYKNQIADLEAQIKAREKFVKTRTQSPTDAELESLKKQRDAAKAEFDKLFDVRQQTGLETLKSKLRKNIQELERKLREGDFSKKPKKPPIILDSEAQSLAAKSERLKRDFQAGLIRDRLKNRANWEKAMDWGVKYRRFGVLSSIKVIPKLISAGIQRLASLPLEELAGSALGQIPGVSAVYGMAPLEGGGLNVAAEMKGFKEAFSQGLKDAYDVLKTGRSDLDVLYGKPKASYTGEFELNSALLELPGRVHGSIKSPVKRAVFERAVERLGTFYTKQGLDVADPVVKARIAIEAYKAANRSIFLQDNFVSSKVNAFLSEHIDPKTGRPYPGSKLWSTAGRIALPITRVPINIVAETMQYAGGLASGSVRLANAFRKGIENLPPEQADLIMRELKKGSVGAAVLALGYFNSDVIGGYYQPGEKRKPGDVKAGRIRVYGVDIPSWLLHNPLLETLQMGATIRRYADTVIKGEEQGIPAGVVAAAIGAVEQVPFVRESVELEKALDPRRRSQVFGEQAKSIAVPAAVSQAAEWIDPAEKRRPRTVLEHIESGIPILREQVPE